MHIDNDLKLDFCDVLIRPKRSTLESRSQVELERVFKTRNGNEFSGIPIIASNMATGTFEMLKSLSKYKCFTAIAKHHSKEWFTTDAGFDSLSYGFYTIGMSTEELSEMVRFSHMLGDIGKLKICIDIANGYTQRFASFVNDIRKEFPANVIIAGNVATPEMVQELVIAGADFVKVGLGSGSECTTRLKSGVGYPQISASIECSDAAHGLGAGIVLDGGMSCPGDIAKSFVANADFVMLGGMFAGTIETDGGAIIRSYETNEVEFIEGKIRKKVVDKKFKLFYGMSSEYAQEQHFGGKKDYRTSEGRMEEVPYIGPVSSVLDDILGGLRSAGTYIGAKTIKDFGKCGTLIRVSHQHTRF